MSWKDEDVAQESWTDEDIAPGGLSPAARKFAMSDKPGYIEQFAGGAKHALDRAAAGLQTVAGKVGLPTGESLQPLVQQGGQFVKETGPVSTAGEIGADMAMSAMPIAKAGQAGRLLARTLGRAPAAIPLAAETAGAAGYGALTADEGEGAKGAAWGAGGNLTGAALARALRGVVKPTDQAQVLLDKGVALTPGQAAGSGSTVHRIEQFFGSNPISGGAIRTAQNRAVEDANVAAAQSVADIVGKQVKLGKPPREAIEQTRDLISKTYDDVLTDPGVQLYYPLQAINHDAAQVAAKFPMMEQHQIAQMDRYVTQRIGGMVRGDKLDGPALKQIDSEIGQQIRNLRNSSNAADKTAAPAWQKLQQSLRESMEFAIDDPVKSADLSKANAAYRQLLAMEKTLLPGAETFTPRRLAATLDRMNIKGTELNKISGAMTKTLPNTVPNSGTAERLIANGLPALLMGGGAGANAMGWDTVGGGMMAAGALGSRTGTRLMTGSTAPQRFLVDSPNAVAAALRALRRSGPAALAAGQKKPEPEPPDNSEFLRKIGAIK